jgi:hypothetical protein
MFARIFFNSTISFIVLKSLLDKKLSHIFYKYSSSFITPHDIPLLESYHAYRYV